MREPSEDWAILVPEDGPGVQLAITVVSSDAQNHQHHHLDLYAMDQKVEVEDRTGPFAPIAFTASATCFADTCVQCSIHAY